MPKDILLFRRKMTRLPYPSRLVTELVRKAQQALKRLNMHSQAGLYLDAQASASDFNPDSHLDALPKALQALFEAGQKE